MQDKKPAQQQNPAVPNKVISEEMTILDFISEKENFSDFLHLIKHVNLDDTLDQEGSFTLLIPSNTAMGKIPNEKLEYLLKEENKELLTQVVELHFVKGEYILNELTNMQELNTFYPVSNIHVRIKEGSLTLSQGKPVHSFVGLRNGNVHVMDRILVHLTF
ncbi:fasciclin domain-containing protein [Gracilimonas sp.]|uniref:fasciclin domain-containing protein n=1 Tax=Gracilimonas sp. TaxID=1974203 RepID=UPI0028715FF4|nr:fasciclin domain-containing protein [Gracilimonas sp.]